MTQFIQLHVLTSYPPSNLNRDDMGRPKTARMGNAERLRISSQSLKRHWRVSDVFEEALAGHIGTRTKRIGTQVKEVLIAGGVKDTTADKIARVIAKQFAKNSSKNALETGQLVHISPAEQQAVDDLVKRIIETGDEPTNEELSLLKHDNMAADIALFGRMLADYPRFNTEAACQVAHAISVQQVAVEDDYFTAVDDLNDHSEDAGAAHIGVSNFAAAVFYQYVCINKDLLLDNLNGDTELAQKALAALTEAVATVAPSGKQNSFGSHAFASYVMAEKGSTQPRSLSVAYLRPVNTDTNNVLSDAINNLQNHQQKFDSVYGDCADSRYVMDVENGMGSLAELKQFVSSDGKANYPQS